MPTAQVWHIGLFRDERTLRPIEYYNKLPSSATVAVCLVLDAMLATGGSAVYEAPERNVGIGKSGRVRRGVAGARV